MEAIAAFFGVTVEFLRRDNRPIPGAPSTPPHINDPNTLIDGCGDQAAGVSMPHSLSVPETIIALHSMRLKAVYEVEICIKNVRYLPADA